MSETFLNRLTNVAHAQGYEEAIEPIRILVEKREVYYNLRDKDSRVALENGMGGVLDKVAVVRADTEEYLGTVGRDYGLVQYERAFGLVEELIKDEGMRILRAGLYAKGAAAVLELEAPGAIHLDGDTKILNRIIVRSTHDGTGKLTVHQTPFSVRNKTVIATGDHLLAFKHSKHVDARLQQAQRTLKRVREEWEAFGNNIRKLVQIKLNKQEATDFAKIVVGGKDGSTRGDNIVEEILKRWEHGAGLGGPACKGTLFGLVMAVCEWADHCKVVRKSKRMDDASAEVHAKLIGDAAKKKMKAYGMALTLKKTQGLELL